MKLEIKRIKKKKERVMTLIEMMSLPILRIIQEIIPIKHQEMIGNGKEKALQMRERGIGLTPIQENRFIQILNILNHMDLIGITKVQMANGIEFFQMVQ